MPDYKIQIIETVVTLIIFIILLKVFNTVIDKVGVKFSYHKTRVKIVKKIKSFVLYIFFIGTLVIIWGIAPSQLAAYLASLFTILGIAFLAQWSILANITSTLIIFFNHQVNIGDTIMIIDKDYQVEGKISDIGVFFVIIKVNEHEYVSIPSTVFMQKMIKKIKR